MVMLQGGILEIPILFSGFQRLQAQFEALPKWWFPCDHAKQKAIFQLEWHKKAPP